MLVAKKGNIFLFIQTQLIHLYWKNQAGGLPVLYDFFDLKTFSGFRIICAFFIRDYITMLSGDIKRSNTMLTCSVNIPNSLTNLNEYELRIIAREPVWSNG